MAAEISRDGGLRRSLMQSPRSLRTLTCLAILSALSGAMGGCSSAPKKHGETPAASVSKSEKPTPPALSPRCESFCETIRSCAKKDGHEELAQLMCSIARCETGDKCTGRIDSPKRRYRGAFQFSPRTWHGLCGPVFARKKLPACKPSKSMYDVCCASDCTAEILSKPVGNGLGNWPVCGKKASR